MGAGWYDGFQSSRRGGVEDRAKGMSQGLKPGVCLVSGVLSGRGWVVDSG
jgi:hypothetical protein